MNCGDAQSALELWAAEETLAAGLPGDLREHLRQCAHCSSRLSAEHVDALVITHATVHEPSPFLWTRLDARLQESAAETADGWLSHWIPRFPALISAGGVKRQVVLSFCLTCLLVSAILIHQQINHFQRTQLLSQIDKQWSELSLTPSSDNPFPSELGSTLNGRENPFPALPETNLEKNPFDAVKS